MSRRTVKNSVETDVYITRPTRLFNACTNLALSRTSHKLRPHATHNACGAEHTISQSALTARRPPGAPLLTHTFPALSVTVTTSKPNNSIVSSFYPHRPVFDTSARYVYHCNLQDGTSFGHHMKGSNRCSDDAPATCSWECNFLPPNI